MRSTIMEVSIASFEHNINEIQKYVGDKKLMPVIKANAYGTHINKRLDVINKFDIVAVANTEEAIELREIGYNKDIFVLNQQAIGDLEEIIQYDVVTGLSEEYFLNYVIEHNLKIRVHLEIETGMNRTGIKLEDLQSFIDKVKQSNVIVEGVYTHLSSADFDEEYTNKQLDIFRQAVEIVKNNFDSIKYVHSSASNGLLNYDDGVSNLVRPGLIMYGYESYEGVKDKLDIKPVATLYSEVVYIKNVNPGDAISYSQKFVASKPMRIATVPIGYADGYRRSLSNKGMIVVNGCKAPVVGSVCMDSIMVDVTDIQNVSVGTKVYIWDNDNYTLEDIAKECDTINYEIISTISYRVPRKFV